MSLRSAQVKLARLCHKINTYINKNNEINKNKGAGGVAQVVQHLPRMHEVLGLIPSTERKKRKERKKSM
jgi:hypothetical protein